ncbi:MAG: HutP family protein [Bacillota bacterium]
MEEKCFSKWFFGDGEWTVGSAAMLLAITRTLKGEEEVKKILDARGFRFVVTEIGGVEPGEFQNKITKQVVGASLNNGLIKKSSGQVHALLHASEEAKRGILVNASSSISLALKVAIVRDNAWIAVAMFGQSAMHPVTNHERAGLGIMHICD